MDKQYIMNIALNEQGNEDYNYGIEDSKNLLKIFLPKEEFLTLFNKYVIQINKALHLLIDEFEDEEIPYDVINDTLSIIDEKDIPTFASALKMAKEYKSSLYLNF